MTVELWYQANDLFPGGFRSSQETTDAALAQAVEDLRVGRVPGPDRIVADDGSIAYDLAAIEKAAAKA